MFDTYSETFAERASSYHSAMKEVPDAREAEFRAVVEPIADAADGLVCDMPAGGGYLMAYLPRRMRYVGVEPVARFVEAAGEASVGGTIKADLADVPLPAGAADYVISLAGLHHEADLTPVFREMRRITRRGGRIVIADVAAGTPAARFLNGFVDRHNALGHNGRFLDHTTCNLLESAQLSVELDELLEVPWMFDSLEQAGAFCGKLFGLAGLGPQEIARALAAEIGFDDSDGRPRLRWSLRRIVCSAA